MHYDKGLRALNHMHNVLADIISLKKTTNASDWHKKHLDAKVHLLSTLRLPKEELLQLEPPAIAGIQGACSFAHKLNDAAIHKLNTRLKDAID